MFYYRPVYINFSLKYTEIKIKADYLTCLEILTYVNYFHLLIVSSDENLHCFWSKKDLVTFWFFRQDIILRKESPEWGIYCQIKCITLICDFILVQLAADQIIQNEVEPSLLLKGPFLLWVRKEYYQPRIASKMRMESKTV